MLDKSHGNRKDLSRKMRMLDKSHGNRKDLSSNSYFNFYKSIIM